MRFELDLDIRGFERQLKQIERNALNTVETAMNDVLDELIRIASEITPFDKGILQRSYSKSLSKSSGGFKGEVTFSVREGNFNYALWIHEGVYNLGSGSAKRPGTTGWSGKRYTVGRKYLERPLKGEEEAFNRHIANEIKKAVGD